jgi:hypothetical protein
MHNYLNQKVNTSLCIILIVILFLYLSIFVYNAIVDVYKIKSLPIEFYLNKSE